MNSVSKGFARCFLSLLILGLVSACSTLKPTESSRHGLLDDGDKSSGTSKNLPFRKTASEMYAPKEGSQVVLPGKWQWPLDGIEISSPYGERGQKFHQGVDLRAKNGTQVHAAAEGTVVYVGSKIRGYGKMVVLKHESGLYTVYAHHSKNIVKIGQKVEKGETIALSGHSGHSHGAHLHFEIRRGTQSYDPEYALNMTLKTSVNRKIASKSRLDREFEE